MIPCRTSETTTVSSGSVYVPVEQLAELRLGEEEAEVLVSLAVHGHADAMGERGQRYDHLGVVARHAVVGDHRRLDAVLRQLAEELERDVRDDLDVHPRVIVDLHPCDRVDVRDVPPALQLIVAVDALENVPELAVRPLGNTDAHLAHRLGGSEPHLARGLSRDGVVDPLAHLRIQLGVFVRHA